jgi:tryptophanyl-tRNA synthetase
MQRCCRSCRAFQRESFIFKSHHQVPSSCNTESVRSYSTQASSTVLPRVIFSGIQPTGVPHLGNYLGACRPWVKLQNERLENDVLNFSIVDLHALTVSQDPKQLEKWRLDTYMALLAVGLDPKASRIFYQSEVGYALSIIKEIVAHASRFLDTQN